MALNHSPGQWIESVTDWAIRITDWGIFPDWMSSHARLADPPVNAELRHIWASWLADCLYFPTARLGGAVRTTDCNPPIASPTLSTGQPGEDAVTPKMAGGGPGDAGPAGAAQAGAAGLVCPEPWSKKFLQRRVKVTT